MAERSYSGDDRGISLAWQTPPWAKSQGETVGPNREPEGEERTVGTESADIRVPESDSGDANPGLEADERRDELAEMLEAVGRAAFLDTAALAEQYGTTRAKLSGDLAKVERDRLSNDDYEVTLADS